MRGVNPLFHRNDGPGVRVPDVPSRPLDSILIPDRARLADRPKRAAKVRRGSAAISGRTLTITNDAGRIEVEAGAAQFLTVVEADTPMIVSAPAGELSNLASSLAWSPISARVAEVEIGSTRLAFHHMEDEIDVSLMREQKDIGLLISPECLDILVEWDRCWSLNTRD